MAEINYLSIDTEFSAFYSVDKGKSGELLQVSIIPVINGIPDTAKAFNEFCAPQTKVWSSHAEKVHKITRKRAETFQSRSELAEKLINWVKQFDDVFTCMGYSCLGDKRFIERMLYEETLSNHWFLRTRTEWKDVKKMVTARKKLIPRKSHTLGSMCDYFGIELNAHDALSDALGTFKVYERVRLLETPTEGRQRYLTSKLTEIEKKRKYTDLKYMMLDGYGGCFISEHATKDKEALRIVLEQIWNLYVEDKE